MVEGVCEPLKFSAGDEQHRPQGDLDQVCHERECYRQRDDCKIDQGACAGAPESHLMAKEVYRRSQSERMDKNRTCGCAYANHQWIKDRELRILRHLPPPA